MSNSQLYLDNVNYLAHLYLSSSNHEIRIGNFIADSVKGSLLSKYPEKVVKGIKLHRFIDDYTDHSPMLTIVRKNMQPTFPKYYGLILDVYFDHFLAKNWKNYSPISLRAYVRNFYLVLVLNYFVLPPRVKRSLPFLISQNWLESYKEMEGIALIFDRMHKYRGLPWDSKPIVAYLADNYSDIEEAFILFFDDLQKAARLKAIEIKAF